MLETDGCDIDCEDIPAKNVPVNDLDDGDADADENDGGVRNHHLGNRTVRGQRHPSHFKKAPNNDLPGRPDSLLSFDKSPRALGPLIDKEAS